MSETIRARAGATLDLIARARARAGSPRVERSQEHQELLRRVSALEDDVKEARRLHRRLAELTDVVEELLVPIAQRDEARLQDALDRYRAGL